MRFSEFKLFENVFNPEVKKLQQFLIAKGYDLGPTKDDGIMGKFTKSAEDAYRAGIPPSRANVPSKTTTSNTPTVTQPSTPSQSTVSTGEIMPAKGPISGQYGRTVTAPNGEKISHPGVDIAAPQGSSVIAPADGKIVFAGPAGSAGNLVELETADGVKHRFMHLSKILVQVGTSVKKGQQVGAVGSTGFSTGPHLHWEKYASGRQVNPMANVG